MSRVAFARWMRMHGFSVAMVTALCCLATSAAAQGTEPADALGVAPAADASAAVDQATPDEFEQADREEARDDVAVDHESASPTADTPAAGPSNSAVTSLESPNGPPATPSGYAQPAGTTYTTPVFVAPARPAQPRRVAPTSLPNMLVIDPLAAAQGLLVLQYGRALSERWSFLLGPEYLIPGVLEDGVTGGGLIASVSFHLLRPAPAGLWLGPRFEFLFLRDGPDDGHGYLVGGAAGYTWQWGHFTLSLGAGASYVRFVINGHSVLNKVLPTGRSALGFAF